jgi:hypothetical protein
MISRIAIHKTLDEQLNAMGYINSIDIESGAIEVKIQIQNGKIVQATKEREFLKEVKQ